MKKLTYALAAVVALLPAVSTASTLLPSGAPSPNNTIADGGTYDIKAGPYFWDATFNGGDAAGSVSFTFTNAALSSATAGVTQGTVLQFTGSFDGVTVAWANGGSQSVAPNTNAIINISTLITGGSSDVLTVSWGAVSGAKANIDLDIAAVPLPAGGLLLTTALVGAAGLRRKRRN